MWIITVDEFAFLNWPKAAFPVFVLPLCDSIQETFLNAVLTLMLLNKSPKERMVAVVGGEGRGWVIPEESDKYCTQRKINSFVLTSPYISSIFCELINLCS